MTVEAVLDVAIETIWTIIITSAPLLIVSLVVGLVVSIFQAVTSIQEQTLTFVPKILAIFICMMIFGSFILNTIIDFIEKKPIDKNHSVYTIYTLGTNNLEKLEKKLDAAEIGITERIQLGPVVGSHVGPEAFGIIYICEK